MKKMNLFHLYANDEKLAMYDCLHHAVNNCYTTCPLLEKTPTKIIHSVMYVNETTHEVEHEVIQAYDLTTEEIIKIIKECNLLLHEYDERFKDFTIWATKSNDCEAHATALILKELKKQARV